jgi:N-acetyl sugar amidotransferase
MASTRPRIQFDANGRCNACQWQDKKASVIDWASRWKEIELICEDHRLTDDHFDVLVPCSGGKDGSYVVWRLKHDLGMHPLCVTFRPQMRTWIGLRNLENFKDSGFDHIEITPNVETYRKMSRFYFETQGRPKWPFVMGISTALIKLASQLDIHLMVFGEQGEVEYSGAQETESLQRFTREFLKNIYYEGNDPSEWGTWWQMPTDEQLNDIYVTWWSLFEDWDPEHHARHAKDHVGFEMLVGGSIGTFTNYAQLDDHFQDLHAFMVFCKYGFGRCTSDASIEIRRGRMTRDQGMEAVRKLDGTFPLELLDAYCDYFSMTKDEFWKTVDKFVNWDILERGKEKWRPYILK